MGGWQNRGRRGFFGMGALRGMKNPGDMITKHTHMQYI